MHRLRFSEIVFLGSLAQDTRGQTQNLLWHVIILECLSIMAKKNPTDRKKIP